MVEKRLAPWEEIGYFNVPVPLTVALTAGIGQRILPANTNRVGVLFTLGYGTDSVVLTLSEMGFAVAVLTSLNPNIGFTEADWGSLVSQEWWGSSTSSASISATEIVLRQWPEENPL